MKKKCLNYKLSMAIILGSTTAFASGMQNEKNFNTNMKNDIELLKQTNDFEKKKDEKTTLPPKITFDFNPSKDTQTTIHTLSIAPGARNVIVVTLTLVGVYAFYKWYWLPDKNQTESQEKTANQNQPKNKR
jgi:uncharacterized cupredoxin-like copper-binding protein